MYDDFKKIPPFFLVMTAFFSLARLTRTAGDGFFVQRETTEGFGSCRDFSDICL
jgi:hypothetical protein